MIDERCLSNMNYMTVVEMLNEQQEVLNRYSSTPEVFAITNIDSSQAVADVYSENAQLYRRLAEIYDNWSEQLRSQGCIEN